MDVQTSGSLLELPSDAAGAVPFSLALLARWICDTNECTSMSSCVVSNKSYSRTNPDLKSFGRNTASQRQCRTRQNFGIVAALCNVSGVVYSKTIVLRTLS